MTTSSHEFAPTTREPDGRDDLIVGEAAGSDAAMGGADTLIEAERRTGYLELFFDLVFVFAITQVTAMILEDATAPGFARAALVLFLLWWGWGGYTWLTNAIEVETVVVRVAFLAAAAGSFLTALAVPHAFDAQGVWFAVPFFLVRVLHIGLYVWGLRTDRAHQAAVRQLAGWFLVAPGFVLVGGLVPDPARSILWLVSIVVDVAGAMSVGRAGFRVSPAHFAERYGLFIIIALGESIVAIGAGAAELERDLTFAIAVLVAFAGAATLWWAYFGVPARAAERALQAAPPNGRAPLARDLFSLLHYPLVLGIVLGAVAAKKTLAHPGDPLSAQGRWALGLGVAIYLIGFVLSRYRAARRVAWERTIASVAVVVAVTLLPGLPAVALLAVVVAILALAVGLEAARIHALAARMGASGRAATRDGVEASGPWAD